MNFLANLNGIIMIWCGENNIKKIWREKQKCYKSNSRRVGRFYCKSLAISAVSAVSRLNLNLISCYANGLLLYMTVSFLWLATEIFICTFKLISCLLQLLSARVQGFVIAINWATDLRSFWYVGWNLKHFWGVYLGENIHFLFNVLADLMENLLTAQMFPIKQL